MIACPSCGTRNRRGSKYCYCCGQPLDVVFNVSCPACDRLNPGGSAFCAFCGARIVGPAPAAEPDMKQPAAAEQLARATPEPLPSAPKDVEPLAPPNTRDAVAAPPNTRDAVAARPQRELPHWLYEQPAEHPEVEALPPGGSLRAAAEPTHEQSKYLSDIPGALPKTEGWMSSVPAPRGKPVGAQAPRSKRKTQGGCLMLPLLALLGVIGLVLVTGV